MSDASDYMSRIPLDDETDFMMEAEIAMAPATPATNEGGDEDEHLWPYL